MAEESQQNIQYVPDTIQPEKEESSGEIPKRDNKSAEPAEYTPQVTTSQGQLKETIEEWIPLTVYDKDNMIPYGASLLKLQSFWDSNIDGLQDKVREMDIWIKGEIFRQGYSNTTASYRELMENAMAYLGISKNLTRVEKLNRLHTYFKIIKAT